MKIRNYLAILIVIVLVGSNGVRLLISEKYDELSAQSQSHAEALLWQKDFQRTIRDIEQYLISTDLVIGSGETYLANSTVDKGRLIAKELLLLADSNHLLDSIAQLTDSATDFNTINSFIELAAIRDASNHSQELNALLKKYDPIALVLSRRINELELSVNSIVDQNALSMKTLETSLKPYLLAIQLLFSFLVIMAWIWASRKICKPIQLLRKEAELSEIGRDFNGVASGPEEIKQLSENFSNLTQSLLFKASHDPLTNLFNRRAFGLAVKAFLSEAKNENVEHALCYIDLDHFKVLNDTCGHAAGDEMLEVVAGIFLENVRTSDVVARLGGDEFALLLRDCSINKAQKVANTIRTAIRDYKYHWQGQVFRIGASIGITVIDANSGSMEETLNAADIACMQAKGSGRDAVINFDDSQDLLHENLIGAIGVNQIKNALIEDRFELYHQEIVPLQGEGASIGKHYEVLLRMHDDEGNLMSPAVFMPLVEKYRLGSEIDRWVINASIDWLNKNPQELADLSMCSINLSGQSVGCPDIKNFILGKLSTIKFPAHKLCFEITETAAITDLLAANELIAVLKKQGCRFALDDFGSGLSSFAYLKNLQVDYVKIDGAFVKDMMNNESDKATVRAINDVAKATGKETIAEFVETKEVADALREMGINFAQGYYFDKPSPLVAKPYLVSEIVESA